MQRVSLSAMVFVLVGCDLYWSAPHNERVDAATSDAAARPDAPNVDARTDAPVPAADANAVLPDASVTAISCDFLSERFDFPTGRNPTFITAGDFNTDGRVDVA